MGCLQFPKCLRGFIHPKNPWDVIFGVKLSSVLRPSFWVSLGGSGVSIGGRDGFSRRKVFEKLGFAKDEKILFQVEQ